MKLLAPILFAAAALLAPAAYAQGFPNKPIRETVQGYFEPVGGTPQQFASMLNVDRTKWKKIITERKLTVD